MFSLNRIQLIGYQTQPISVRQTPGGTSVTDLNIVVPALIKTESGETIASRSFHTVTAWGGMAEVAAQFLKPGGQVFIAGRLQTDSWEDEKTKEKRSKTKIIASELILLDPKAGQMEVPASAGKVLGCCNRADVIGNVTRDPEIRTTTNGTHVLTLGVATNERWKDKTSGEMKEKSEFHSVVVWGDLAQEVNAAIKKGNRVFVTGRVQTRSWETQAGAKRYTTEIVADGVSLLGVKNAVAEESIRSDSNAGAAREESSASRGQKESEPAMAGIPDISYASEIKVEDLPF
ncbi:single-stranded DNA-binding protein [Candidatus Peregrinibacteria bacterium]|nr:single-stranded DNA-binding protein [Candidatus Peregrinibacteria bacterium]